MRVVSNTSVNAPSSVAIIATLLQGWKTNLEQNKQIRKDL